MLDDFRTLLVKPSDEVLQILMVIQTMLHGM